MIIRSRAPLRLGLAGGGTDVSPYCDQHGGAVLNVTIDQYAYTIIEPLSDERVCFTASDIGCHFELTADEAMKLVDPLILHRAVYRRIVNQFNDGRPLPCASLQTFPQHGSRRNSVPPSETIALVDASR